jgi:predicted DNA-binding transcriptional regulator YafY
MKHADHQATRRTLADLERARARRTPVTMDVLKAEKDERGRRTGRLVRTIRTLEIYAITTTTAGHLLIEGMDRESGEWKHFRVDRILTYRVHHRARFVLTPPAERKPAPMPETAERIIAAELARDDADYLADDYTQLALAA